MKYMKKPEQKKACVCLSVLVRSCHCCSDAKSQNCWTCFLGIHLHLAFRTSVWLLELPFGLQNHHLAIRAAIWPLEPLPGL